MKAGQPESLHKYYERSLDKTLKGMKSIHTNGEITVVDYMGLTGKQMQMALSDVELARAVLPGAGDTTIKILTEAGFKKWYGRGWSEEIGGACKMAQPSNGGNPEVALYGASYKKPITVAEELKASVYRQYERHYSRTHAQSIWEGMAESAFEKQMQGEPHWSTPPDTRGSFHTTIHEFGHATDFSRVDPAWDAKSLAIYEEGMKNGTMPSGYSKDSHREAYAESFAQWVQTRGASTNPVVMKYAETFGWRKP